MNPFLPLNEYVADGEPHVYDGRVYLFGSHDKENGTSFCELGYEFFSAPLNDLSDWTSKGVNYEACQDPLFKEGYDKLYAPDVVRGNDGRYYLYYAMSGEGHFTSPIHVAVCGTPDGKYEYYGAVRNKDGTPFTKKITFDPGVINDGGSVRLYFGWSLNLPEEHLPKLLDPEARKGVLMYVFGKTKEDVDAEDDDVMNAYEVKLGEDNLTVVDGPHLIVPGQIGSQTGEYRGHGFFEASSIRKINGKYYFIYSSLNQHELCYAVSEYPDRDFHYGGVIVSNGDIGYLGRKEEDRLFATGNNHGSLVEVNGKWYVTYHRHTNKFTYSREACAEEVRINDDGSIDQVMMTSMGWERKPLEAKGEYSALRACNITNGKMPHNGMKRYDGLIPHIACRNGERIISEITDGTLVAFKDFAFRRDTDICVEYRGTAEGGIDVFLGKEKLGTIDVVSGNEWHYGKMKTETTRTGSLEFRFRINGLLEMKTIKFE